MRLFLTTLLLSTILLAKCNEVKLATLAARITKTGFDYVSRFGHKIIDFEIPRIEWPEIDIPIDVGPGSGRVVVSDLYIPQFQTPNFTFFLEPPKSVHWISKDGLINLKGKINVKYTLLVPIYFSGTVYVTAANIKTNYSISMHDSEGRPQIDINYCQTDIETLKISIEGGIVPWLLNLFKNQLDILFKKLLKTQFCDALKTTLINELNVILIQLPTHIDVGSNFYINYNYNSSPIVTSTYVQLETYADAIIGNKTCGIYVKPMNTIDAPEGFMGNIWISSALPNCFLKSAHESNLLRLVVNKNMSPQLESFLRTSCKFIDICIGKFFSKLKKEYPDQYLDVAVRSEERPRFLMSDDGVSVLGLFDLDFVIAPYTEKSEILARLVIC
uniref:BPI1 domain-containing protein n=1 Tax=Rhabditophanes sp. KR3021 TaxID=114890 RepID=A0AC35U7U0_9BILA